MRFCQCNLLHKSWSSYRFSANSFEKHSPPGGPGSPGGPGGPGGQLAALAAHAAKKFSSNNFLNKGRKLNYH